MRGTLCLLFLISTVAIGRGMEGPLAIIPEGNVSCHVVVTSRAFQNHKAKDGKPDLATITRLPILTEIQITRVGSLIRYQLTWTGDRQTEAWMDAKSDYLVQRHPRTGKLLVLPGNTLPIPLLADLKPEAVSWIQPGDLTEGDSRLDNKKCQHYQRTIPLPDDGEALYQAWIDAKTRLPLALDDSNALYKFTFETTAPVGPLVMPDDYRRAINQYREALQPPKRL
jgi:hypothetical protein